MKLVFGMQSKFNQTRRFMQKNYPNFFCKFFFDPHFSSAQNFFDPKFFRPKFFLTPIFVGTNFFRPKFCLTQILFPPTNFLGHNFFPATTNFAKIFRELWTWNLGTCIWYSEFVIQDLGFGICDLGFGIWDSGSGT